MDDEGQWLVRTSPLRRTYFSGSDNSKDREQLCFPALRIRRGGLIAIVGGSGVGKTTLLNLLSGLDRPDVAGDILRPEILLNTDGTTIDVAERRGGPPPGLTGFVFQQGYLLPNATVALNMAIPSLSVGNRVRCEDLEQRLKRLELPKAFRTKRAWQLSGGQAQRVALERALLHHPCVVFADEPTSSLDTKLAKKVVEWLKNDWLASDRGRSVIWVTHDLALAAACADQILALTPGIARRFREVELEPVPNPRDEALIHDWVYEDAPFPGERPTGAQEDMKQAPTMDPVAEEGPVHCQSQLPSGGRERDKCRAVELSLAWKLAVGEVFSRRAGIEKTHRNNRFSQWLARTNREDQCEKNEFGDRRSGWGALFKGYADLSSAVVLELSALLIALAFFAGMVNERIYTRTLSDPLSCQAVLQGRIGESGGYLDGEAIASLSRRPWRGGLDQDQFDPPAGYAYAPASCGSGPSAFGRRDLRTWPLGVWDGGKCIEARLNAQILVSESNEPLLQKIDLEQIFVKGLVAGKGLAALGDLLTSPGYYIEDDIFLSSDTFQMLKDNTGVEEPREICVLNSVDEDYDDPGNRFLVRIAGVVAHIPAARRGGYQAFLADEVYRRIVDHFGLPDDLYTNVVVYFDPELVGTVKAYLLPGQTHTESGRISERQWFVTDKTFSDIEQRVRNARLVRGFVFFLSAAILLIVFLYLTNFAALFLDNNRRALAVLLSFGVRDALLSKLVAFRILLNFHLWLLFPLIGILLGLLVGIQGVGLKVILEWGIPMLALLALVFSWLAVVAISLGAAKWAVSQWRKRNPILAQSLA